ncbi:MAG: acyl-CoA desaturase, partial [Micromonosporaceae bacterium]|nr:acyl-CoA desaturase [Micromonosporaceae bacterium]
MPLPSHLTDAQIDELGRELDAIRQRVVADLGEADAAYIRKIVKVQQRLEVAGRGLLFLGFLPPAWLAGVACLSASKILDNMEIGHNVMHGQYDWMRDPKLNSKMFEWDTVCPAEQWKHSHNYMHHTYTNILDKDRDIGYGVLRMERAQRWNPYYLGNPVYAFFLMLCFEWGVMLHDLEIERILAGERSWAETRGLRRQMWHKGFKQVLKDYVLFPALTGPLFLSTLAGNAVANLVRNVWAYSIIFCGHFPSGVAVFTEEETENE